MDTEWQITSWYLIVFIVTVIVAKVVSIFVAGRNIRSCGTFFLAPSLCIDVWEVKRRVGRSETVTLLLCSLLDIALLVTAYWLYVPLYSHMPWWQQAYLAVLPFWLLLEAMQGLSRLLWLFTGRVIPLINDSPWRAGTVAEFWGRRWNRLFGDWLRQVGFQPFRRRPHRALLITFFLSGFIHELLVSLPYHLVYDRSVWGWLTAYFILQYLAILLERRFFRTRRVLNRIFLWCTVIGPVPLVLNPGTLLIFHLGG
jgi:hypothetical protein